MQAQAYYQQGLRRVRNTMINRRTTANMLLPQTALVPLPTPVEGLNISSRNKITKGGMRQAQDRWWQSEK